MKFYQQGKTNKIQMRFYNPRRAFVALLRQEAESPSRFRGSRILTALLFGFGSMKFYQQEIGSKNQLHF